MKMIFSSLMRIIDPTIIYNVCNAGNNDDDYANDYYDDNSDEDNDDDGAYDEDKY